MNVRTYTIGDNCWTAILPAAAFGLLVRLLTGQDFVDFPVASTAFLGLLPVAIGVLPILFRKTTDTSRWRDFLYPVYAVGIFGLVTLATGIEDVICLLILGIPFLLVAGLTGLAVGYIVRRRNRRKPLVLLVVLPLLVGPFEGSVQAPPTAFSVERSIFIEATPGEVYAHLAEIPKLDATYQKGWLQYAGIPQPRYSALKANNGDTLRLGYFSQGMVLTERIKEAVPGKTLAFSVHLSESILRDTPIDKHVLESGYFDFETVRYTLRPKGNGTELSLRCTYTLATTVNSYGNAWANYLLGDFEERLLEALKAALAAS